LLNSYSDEDICKLDNISLEIRKKIIEMLYKIGNEYKGHAGPALSIVDIITCLYFSEMNIYPEDPKNENRDRFILSKGHACPALYVALALRGFFPTEELFKFRHINSILQGHPDMNKTPGVDFSTGSLGNGLSIAFGIALSGKIYKKNYRVFCIVGDGEVDEGIIWESLMSSSKYNLNNLILFVDRNNLQSCGKTCDISDIEPLDKKFKSFNWNILTINGHKIREILSAIYKIKNRNIQFPNKPTVIIANTIKGKGISFIENNNSWHQCPITKEQYIEAMKELGGIG